MQQVESNFNAANGEASRGMTKEFRKYIVAEYKRLRKDGMSAGAAKRHILNLPIQTKDVVGWKQLENLLGNWGRKERA